MNGEYDAKEEWTIVCNFTVALCTAFEMSECKFKQ
jgi:hypothetical protein